MDLSDKVARLAPETEPFRGMLQTVAKHAREDPDLAPIQAGRIVECLVNDLLGIEDIKPDDDLIRRSAGGDLPASWPSVPVPEGG